MDRIINNISEAHRATGGKKKLYVTDETDLITSVEIGEKPIVSCQHWSGRGLGTNNGLASYMADPNTKIFTIHGERGQLIARSIARILSDKDGNPVMHIEDVYSANPSSEIKKQIVDFALKKAKRIGIPLASSDPVPGFTKLDRITLESFGSRSEDVYVDSADGLMYEGKYKIKRASIIDK